MVRSIVHLIALFFFAYQIVDCCLNVRLACSFYCSLLLLIADARCSFLLLVPISILWNDGADVVCFNSNDTQQASVFFSIEMKQMGGRCLDCLVSIQ